MYVIGLTGNIATGKSTVARMLAEHGASIIDADKLTHQAMRPGSEMHRAIVARFGEGILSLDGTIDRAALGAIVFADPDALADLERLVHPVVEKAILAKLGETNAPVAVVEAIKLLEAGLDRHCDAVWVTTSPRQTQIERLMSTRGLSREQALQRIDAQPDPALKLARADVIIDNSGSLDETHAQVERAWRDIASGGGQGSSIWHFLAQWIALTIGMLAVLPLGSRLIGLSDWRLWVPLAPVCPVLAAVSLWLIQRL